MENSQACLRFYWYAHKKQGESTKTLHEQLPKVLPKSLLNHPTEQLVLVEPNATQIPKQGMTVTWLKMSSYFEAVL